MQKSRIDKELANQISHYLQELNPKSKHRKCLNCHTVFKLIHRNRYYCSSRCSRDAHYLRFKIRNFLD